jgi:hypothetical protein
MSRISRRLLQRHKGRRGGDVTVFGMQPDEVLRSEAHTTLPPVARNVLQTLSAQYRGNNNGSLTLTRATAREYGINNAYMLDESLRENEARGLIIKTRHGTDPVGTLRPRSSMYALAWHKIDPPKPEDPHHATPTLTPPDTWRSWRASTRRLHWTVKRRDRTKEREAQLRKLEEEFRKRYEEERRLQGDGASPMHPMGTSVSTQRVQGSGQIRTHRVPERGHLPSPNGCASDISGSGGSGTEGESAGGVGQPLPGTSERTDASAPPSPPVTEAPLKPATDGLQSARELVRQAQRDRELLEQVSVPLKRRRPTGQDHVLARRMFAAVKAVFPSTREPNWNGWANDVRRMRERDGRSDEEIWALFEWANKHPRYRDAILSPLTLRRRWDELQQKRVQPTDLSPPALTILADPNVDLTTATKWAQEVMLAQGKSVRAARCSIAQKKRRYGAAVLLTAILEYRDRKPCYPSGEPWEADDWIGLRCLELLGKPEKMGGEPIRLP